VRLFGEDAVDGTSIMSCGGIKKRSKKHRQKDRRVVVTDRDINNDSCLHIVRCDTNQVLSSAQELFNRQPLFEFPRIPGRRFPERPMCDQSTGRP